MYITQIRDNKDTHKPSVDATEIKIYSSFFLFCEKPIKY